ncbi:uncharacterized protein LTR77_002893 [Saxophila tyrrhenica]|uniref:Uncharacterized protein n=1 Tax=Saxophila tyrrhenica TaxID=1690608 RepID=A0AAV9PKC2_9PEZI|nr:hypothetical protein LTR77_002893 [Saxophila tyrrhenica]
MKPFVMASNAGTSPTRTTSLSGSARSPSQQAPKKKEKTPKARDGGEKLSVPPFKDRRQLVAELERARSALKEDRTRNEAYDCLLAEAGRVAAEDSQQCHDLRVRLMQTLEELTQTTTQLHQAHTESSRIAGDHRVAIGRVGELEKEVVGLRREMDDKVQQKTEKCARVADERTQMIEYNTSLLRRLSVAKADAGKQRLNTETMRERSDIVLRTTNQTEQALKHLQSRFSELEDQVSSCQHNEYLAAFELSQSTEAQARLRHELRRFQHGRCDVVAHLLSAQQLNARTQQDLSDALRLAEGTPLQTYGHGEVSKYSATTACAAATADTAATSSNDVAEDHVISQQHDQLLSGHAMLERPEGHDDEMALARTTAMSYIRFSISGSSASSINSSAEQASTGADKDNFQKSVAPPGMDSVATGYPRQPGNAPPPKRPRKWDEMDAHSRKKQRPWNSYRPSYPS